MGNCDCLPPVGLPAEPFRPGAIRLYGKPPLHCFPFIFIGFPIPIPVPCNDVCEKLRDGMRRALRSDDLKEVLRREVAASLEGHCNEAERDAQVHAMMQYLDDTGAKALENTVGLSAIDGYMTSYLPVDTGLRADRGEHILSVGVIYGYAYEGHCYKLPRPRIMFLPVHEGSIPAGDCGCDCGFDPAFGYAVWEVDKLERVVALDVRTDDLKTLVLDENLPGSRSPMAYAQSQLLSPQRTQTY